jgi:hypothetical protein
VEAVEAGGEPAVYWVEKRTQSLLAYRSGELEIRIVRHEECRVDAMRRGVS